jgi:hypothetical protein
MTERRLRITSTAICGAMLVAYVVLWLEVDRAQIGRSDFTSTYIGATLLRQGHGASMYNEGLQSPLHAALIAPDHEGNLPFVNPPLAAALALPTTFLSLPAAYRLWSLVQLSLLVIAAVVGIRAAPGQRTLGSGMRVTAGVAALAGVGTGATLLLGQWDGLAALGLALTYSLLRRDRPTTAGAVLAVTSLIGKPHLALGLAAFALGRRDRRLIVGVLAGGAVTAAASLLVAGPAGVAGFIGAALHSTTRWKLASMVSAVGIGGSIFANSAPAYLLGGLVALAAVVGAAAFGSASRSEGPRLEAALAGATLLSLVAAPHAYWDDLALLAPVTAWSLCALAFWHADLRLWAALVGVWMAISLTAYLDIASAPEPWGVLTPWALIAAAGVAAVSCVRLSMGAAKADTCPTGLDQPPPAASPVVAVTRG